MRRAQFLATPLLLTPLMLSQQKETAVTDTDHRDAAVAALKQTTISCPDWVRRHDRYTPAQLAATQWQIAFDELAAIGTDGGTTPPPPPTTGKVDGIGIVRYGGSLPQTSHLDAYDLLIADWDSAALLAKQPGMTFAYRNLGPPGYKPIDLSNPGAFTTEVKNLVQNNPGLDGVFLDNCNASDSSSQLPFIKAALPPLKSAGIKVMLNAVAASGSAGNDGSGDAAWYAQVGPYATHLMSELWMQGRGGPELYRLRLRGSAHYSDYWDEWLKVPKAAHDAGCAFVGMTYGPIDKGIYGRASALLVAAPGDVFCWNPDNVPEGTDPYNLAWMKNMGAPVDAGFSGANPVVRRFSNGAASVNPVAGTASLA